MKIKTVNAITARRFLALFLCLALTVALWPAAAFAENGVPDGQTALTEEKPDEGGGIGGSETDNENNGVESGTGDENTETEGETGDENTGTEGDGTGENEDGTDLDPDGDETGEENENGGPGSGEGESENTEGEDDDTDDESDNPDGTDNESEETDGEDTDGMLFSTSSTFSTLATDTDGFRLISNAADMATMRAEVAALATTATPANYRLTNNITLSGQWTPIGTSSRSFRGVFDGDGYAISGLDVRATADNAGLFGHATDATIKNLTMDGGSVTGRANVGSVVGYASGAFIMDGVKSSASVSASHSCTGGLVGYLFSDVGLIQNSEFSGRVSGATSVGGILGRGMRASTSATTPMNRLFRCRVIPHPQETDINRVYGTTNVGGIIGYLIQTDISESYTNVNVSGTTRVGGIAGYVGIATSAGSVARNARLSVISNCFMMGDVIGRGKAARDVGGIAGNVNSIGASRRHRLENCYQYGNVHNDGKATGGIVGHLQGTGAGTIKSCLVLSGEIKDAHGGSTTRVTSVTSLQAGRIAGRVSDNDKVSPALFVSNAAISDMVVRVSCTIRDDSGESNSKGDPILKNIHKERTLDSIGNDDDGESIYELLGHENGYPRAVNNRHGEDEGPFDDDKPFKDRGWNFNSIWNFDDDLGVPILKELLSPEVQANSITLTINKDGEEWKDWNEHDKDFTLHLGDNILYPDVIEGSNLSFNKDIPNGNYEVYDGNVPLGVRVRDSGIRTLDYYTVEFMRDIRSDTPFDIQARYHGVAVARGDILFRGGELILTAMPRSGFDDGLTEYVWTGTYGEEQVLESGKTFSRTVNGMLELSCRSALFDPNRPGVTVSDGVGFPGGQVSVQILLEDNPGIQGFRIMLAYDDELLEAKDLTAGAGYGGTVDNLETPGTATAVWTRAGSLQTGPRLFTLTFDIDDTAPIGELIPLYIEHATIIDGMGQEMPLNKGYGQIRVLQVGDMNGDGVIGLSDALLLYHYLFDPLPPDPPFYIGAADFNDDGEIDWADFNALMDYLADPENFFMDDMESLTTLLGDPMFHKVYQSWQEAVERHAAAARMAAPVFDPSSDGEPGFVVSTSPTGTPGEYEVAVSIVNNPGLGMWAFNIYHDKEKLRPIIGSLKPGPAVYGYYENEEQARNAMHGGAFSDFGGPLAFPSITNYTQEDADEFDFVRVVFLGYRIFTAEDGVLFTYLLRGKPGAEGNAEIRLTDMNERTNRHFELPAYYLENDKDAVFYPTFTDGIIENIVPFNTATEAPAIAGPSGLTLPYGSPSLSSGPFLVTGAGNVTVRIARIEPTNRPSYFITWNNVSKRLDIASYIPNPAPDNSTSYTVVLTAENKYGKAEHRFVLTLTRSTAAPKIFAPGRQTLFVDYAATQIPVSVTGSGRMDMDVFISPKAGEEFITWNRSSPTRFDIAPGLAAGTYSILMRASNGIPPDSVVEFFLDVKDQPAAPTFGPGQTEMTLANDYLATHSPAFSVSGNPAPEINLVSAYPEISWNGAIRRLEIARGLPVGRYEVQLVAANGIGQNATLDFAVIVTTAAETPSIWISPDYMALRHGEMVDLHIESHPADLSFSSPPLWNFPPSAFTPSGASTSGETLRLFVRNDAPEGSHQIRVTANGYTAVAEIYVVREELELTSDNFSAALLTRSAQINRAKLPAGQGAQVPIHIRQSNPDIPGDFMAFAARPLSGGDDEIPIKNLLPPGDEIRLYTGYGGKKPVLLTELAARPSDTDPKSIVIELTGENFKKSYKNITVVLGGGDKPIVAAGTVNISVVERWPKITVRPEADGPASLNPFVPGQTLRLAASAADGSPVEILSLAPASESAARRVQAAAGAPAGTVALGSAPTNGSAAVRLEVRLDGYSSAVKPSKGNPDGNVVQASVRVTDDKPRIGLNMSSLTLEEGSSASLRLVSRVAGQTLADWGEIEGITVVNDDSPLTIHLFDATAGTFFISNGASLPGSRRKETIAVKFKDAGEVRLPLTVRTVDEGGTSKLGTSTKPLSIGKDYLPGEIVTIELLPQFANIALSPDNTTVEILPPLSDFVRVQESTMPNLFTLERFDDGTASLPLGRHTIRLTPGDVGGPTRVKPLAYHLTVTDKDASVSFSQRGTLDIANPASVLQMTANINGDGSALTNVVLSGEGAEHFLVDVTGHRTFELRANPASLNANKDKFEERLTPGHRYELAAKVSTANNPDGPAGNIRISPRQSISRALVGKKAVTLYRQMPKVAEDIPLDLASATLGDVRIAPSSYDAFAKRFTGGGNFEVIRNGHKSWLVRFEDGLVPSIVNKNGKPSHLKSSYTLRLELWAEGTYRYVYDEQGRPAPAPLVDGQGKSRTRPRLVNVRVNVR